MENPYKCSDTNKRYYTYDYYLKKRFGCKVYRAAMDIGAGCPNRDGTKGVGGCLFCSGRNGEYFHGISDERLKEKFEKGKNAVSGKIGTGEYIAYFQSGTNTYGDTAALKSVFERTLQFEGVTGLALGTRADCVDEEKADMLAELSKKTYLTVELGLQTVHDKTAALCNRCHTYEDFLKAYRMLNERNINIGVHIINGLPYETAEMMIETARKLSRLKLHCIKIHMLYIEKNTPLAEMYKRGDLRVLSQEEYISILCTQLELLPEDLIIARITGDGDRGKLIEPQWSLKKLCVLNELDKEFVRRNSWQGKNFYNSIFSPPYGRKNTHNPKA